MQSDQPSIEVTGLAFATFGQRPDLLGAVFGPELQSATPEFMRHDPVAALYYGGGRLDGYREFGLVAVDPAEPDRPVARAFSVPFAFRDGTKGREELPDCGWDAVICRADEDRRAGRPATAISALEIMVVPRLQRRGSSRLMLISLEQDHAVYVEPNLWVHHRLIGAPSIAARCRVNSKGAYRLKRAQATIFGSAAST